MNFKFKTATAAPSTVTALMYSRNKQITPDFKAGTHLILENIITQLYLSKDTPNIGSF